MPFGSWKKSWNNACPFARRWRNSTFSPLEMFHHLSQPGRAERNVIDRTGALPRALRGPAEIFLLDVAGHPGARADVHHVDIAEVHPVHREAEIGMRAAAHAEHARVPVARRVDVVGGDEEVLYVRERHALIYNACT